MQESKDRFWELWKDGVSRSILYVGAGLVVLGVHFAVGQGWDVLTAGIMLVVASKRPLIGPLDLNVFVFNADAYDGVEDDDADQEQGDGERWLSEELERQERAEQDHVVTSPSRVLTLI